jgi:hypothetical protein
MYSFDWIAESTLSFHWYTRTAPEIAVRCELMLIVGLPCYIRNTLMPKDGT